MQHRQPVYHGGIPVHTDPGTLVAILPSRTYPTLTSWDTPCTAHGCTWWSALRCGTAGV